MLWAEADRMRGLNITQDNLTNQQGVVKNEVKVNVLNQPYGGFPWLDLPQLANTNWYNAHNFYGDLEHLDAATLDDVQQFFKTYYAPSNAVLVVSGDIDPKQTLTWVRQYFGGIPASTPAAAARHLRAAPGKGEAHQQGGPAGDASGDRARLSLPAAPHARVLRDGADRSVAPAGADSRLYESLVRKRGLTGRSRAGPTRSATCSTSRGRRSGRSR